ncbi:MAG TPA: hypothetical protein PLX97_07790 [Gemmatales bacterium]|nr:hypothetical protein [Gemmatales bacterium]
MLAGKLKKASSMQQNEIAFSKYFMKHARVMQSVHKGSPFQAIGATVRSRSMTISTGPLKYTRQSNQQPSAVEMELVFDINDAVGENDALTNGKGGATSKLESGMDRKQWKIIRLALNAVRSPFFLVNCVQAVPWRQKRCGSDSAHD